MVCADCNDLTSVKRDVEFLVHQVNRLVEALIVTTRCECDNCNQKMTVLRYQSMVHETVPRIENATNSVAVLQRQAGDFDEKQNYDMFMQQQRFREGIVGYNERDITAVRGQENQQFSQNCVSGNIQPCDTQKARSDAQEVSEGSTSFMPFLRGTLDCNSPRSKGSFPEQPAVAAHLGLSASEATKQNKHGSNSKTPYSVPSSSKGNQRYQNNSAGGDKASQDSSSGWGKSENKTDGFNCDTCGKEFPNRPSLINHQRTHTGDKPYQCHVCLKHFSQTSSLNLHIRRVHTLGHFVECSVCGIKYATESGLNRHKTNQHGIAPETA